MGRKNNGPPEKADKASEEAAEEAEDSPIVKELKAIDDKYLALQKELDAEYRRIRSKYTKLQQPALEKRAAALERAGGEARGFWLRAMENHPQFDDCIEEWDRPILELLKNITVAENEENDNFKISFHFGENPYFEETVLTKDFEVVESCPYRQENECVSIVCSPITWKAGKDVTVEKTQKKVKGGGAKKNKQKGKVQEEPRNSFFRHCWRNLKKGAKIQEQLTEKDLELLLGDDEELPDDQDEIMDMLMEGDHTTFACLKDLIVPYAVRWYTGEAAPDGGEDGEDEESEEEEDGGASEEESSEEDLPARGKRGGAGKKAAGAKAAAKPGKEEECKQQ